MFIKYCISEYLFMKTLYYHLICRDSTISGKHDVLELIILWMNFATSYHKNFLSFVSMSFRYCLKSLICHDTSTRLFIRLQILLMP